MRHSSLFLLAVLTLPACSVGGSGDNFAWRGDVPAGQWLRIRNTNGGVRVERASGSQVEVSATVRGRVRGRQVNFAVVRDGDGTTVCAVRRRGGECSADGYSYGRTGWLRGLLNLGRNGARVDFVVRLPEGVRMDASTVNGTLAIRGTSSDVRAETVNGRLELAATRGSMRAETVNGSIVARVGTASGDVHLETVNGSVAVIVPEAMGAQLDLETVNGKISSDLPLTTGGRVDRRHVRATLGGGGPRIRAETVNGSVQIARTT
jgi:hypothetical protein